MVEAGFEIAFHCWRWIDYQYVDPDVEREHIRLAVEAIERVSGSRLLDWYTGRVSPNTRALSAEHGGRLYDADSYADGLSH
jgi:allantoinase